MVKQYQVVSHPLRTIISSLDDLKDPELIKTATTSIGSLIGSHMSMMPNMGMPDKMMPNMGMPDKMMPNMNNVNNQANANITQQSNNQNNNSLNNSLNMVNSMRQPENTNFYESVEPTMPMSGPSMSEPTMASMASMFQPTMASLASMFQPTMSSM